MEDPARLFAATNGWKHLRVAHSFGERQGARRAASQGQQAIADVAGQ